MRIYIYIYIYMRVLYIYIYPIYIYISGQRKGARYLFSRANDRAAFQLRSKRQRRIR